MCEYWYDCMKSKYGDKAKLCYPVIDNFIFYVKSEDIFVNLAGYI